MAAQALGKNTFRFKMWSMCIGSGTAGLAGALFAHYINVISPADFVMWLTFFVLLIIMLGGLGQQPGRDHRHSHLRAGTGGASLRRAAAEHFGAPAAAHLRVAADLRHYLPPRGIIPERTQFVREDGSFA